MPELPDVELYLSALRPRVLGHAVRRTRVASPFFVRSFDPPLSAIEGRVVMTLARVGKRLVFGLEDDLFVVVHLMIAGRLRWLEPGAKIPAKLGLAAFDFDHATWSAGPRRWRRWIPAAPTSSRCRPTSSRRRSWPRTTR